MGPIMSFVLNKWYVCPTFAVQLNTRIISMSTCVGIPTYSSLCTFTSPVLWALLCKLLYNFRHQFWYNFVIWPLTQSFVDKFTSTSTSVERLYLVHICAVYISMPNYTIILYLQVHVSTTCEEPCEFTYYAYCPTHKTMNT